MKKFSRKWNANRHNNTVHAGVSDVFNIKTERFVDKRKPHSDYEADMDDMEDPYERIVLNLVGKMLRNFEELENLLSHKTEEEKNRYLSELLAAVLMTPNPVKSLNDTVTYERSIKAKIKFVNYFSKGKNISPLVAESSLRALIKENPWIKKNNQI